MSTLDASTGRKDAILIFIGGLALLLISYFVSVITRNPNPCEGRPIEPYIATVVLLLSVGACIASPFASTRPFSRKLLLAAAALAIWILCLAALILGDMWMFGLPIC